MKNDLVTCQNEKDNKTLPISKWTDSHYDAEWLNVLHLNLNELFYLWFVYVLQHGFEMLSKTKIYL